jgi:cytidine deaminase
MPVILANMKGLVVRTTVAELLPGAFTERALHPSNTERQAKR